VLASFGLCWWQHMIVRGLNEHCVTAEVIGCRKTILMSRIQLCPSSPTIPFKLCRRQFTSKLPFQWQSVRLKGRRLNALKYIYHRLFFTCPALCGLPRSSSLNNMTVAITEEHPQRIESDKFHNFRHFVSRSALKFQIYK
jgi:hypothetical protein